MKVLLTNDDGFEAEGIRTLFKVLSEKHDVCMVAPEKNRSGASSSLTMFSKLRLREHGNGIFSLDGSPVDCVISALKGNYIPFVPDVVVSGINNGANMGTDIIYSGTCGAARQACLYSVPAIALSAVTLNKGETFNFAGIAGFVLDNLEKLVPLCGKEKKGDQGVGLPYFVNINGGPFSPYKGVRNASPCGRDYRDEIHIEKEGDETYSNCVGYNRIVSVGDEDCDFKVVRDGYLSLTLIETSPAWKNINLEEGDAFVL